MKKKREDEISSTSDKMKGWRCPEGAKARTAAQTSVGRAIFLGLSSVAGVILGLGQEVARTGRRSEELSWAWRGSRAKSEQARLRYGRRNRTLTNEMGIDRGRQWVFILIAGASTNWY